MIRRILSSRRAGKCPDRSVHSFASCSRNPDKDVLVTRADLPNRQHHDFQYVYDLKNWLVEDNKEMLLVFNIFQTVSVSVSRPCRYYLR
jgi:hypothetical protein